MPAIDILLTIWLFWVGACVGSFLNVCIYRLPAGLSVVWPPSHCTKCHKKIAWYDNVPVLSYFILRGQCRGCGAKFSIQYAAIEALTGLLFAGFYVAYFVCLARGAEFGRAAVWEQWTIYFAHMALVAALLVSSVIDFKTKEIYTAVTNGGMIIAVLACAAVPALQGQSFAPQWFGQAHLDAAVASVLGLLVGGGLIWATRILGHLAFRREAMGFGDVLLMGMIGAALGWEGAVLVYFIAPFMGLFFGVWQLLRKKDHEVPYGPFLSLATLVVLIAQPELAAWFSPGLSAMWQAAFGG